MTERHEPGPAELGLIGQFCRGPLGGKPDAPQYDGEDDNDLSDEQFGRGHAGLRPHKNQPVRARPKIPLSRFEASESVQVQQEPILCQSGFLPPPTTRTTLHSNGTGCLLSSPITYFCLSLISGFSGPNNSTIFHL